MIQWELYLQLGLALHTEVEAEHTKIARRS
jgi:hypothetical protein